MMAPTYMRLTRVYTLSWCQGGISMIDSLLASAVVGTIIEA
jgi:hypothetical protein